VAQGVGPEFKPQYCIKKEKKEFTRSRDRTITVVLAWKLANGTK
jgi:hypothetical protein